MKSRKSKPAVDVLVSGGGSLFVFSMISDSAKSWAEENISREGFQPNFPNQVYVEHRYAHDLAQGLISSGLVVR